MNLEPFTSISSRRQIPTILTWNSTRKCVFCAPVASGLVTIFVIPPQLRLLGAVFLPASPSDLEAALMNRTVISVVLV
jgi:hypothetical protein